MAPGRKKKAATEKKPPIAPPKAPPAAAAAAVASRVSKEDNDDNNNQKNDADDVDKNMELPELWKMLDRELRVNIGTSVKCGICLSTVVKPMRTPCVHSFCQDCVLASLVTSSSCPECKSPISRRSLQPFDYLEELAQNYKQLLVEFGFCPSEYTSNFTTLTQRHVGASNSSSSPSSSSSSNSPEHAYDRLAVATTWNTQAIPIAQPPEIQVKENQVVVHANQKAYESSLREHHYPLEDEAAAQQQQQRRPPPHLQQPPPKLPDTQEILEQTREQQMADHLMEQENDDNDDEEEEFETPSEVLFATPAETEEELSSRRKSAAEPNVDPQDEKTVAQQQKENHPFETNMSPISKATNSQHLLPTEASKDPTFLLAKSSNNNPNDIVAPPAPPQGQELEVIPDGKVTDITGLQEDSSGALHWTNGDNDLTQDPNLYYPGTQPDEEDGGMEQNQEEGNDNDGHQDKSLFSFLNLSPDANVNDDDDDDDDDKTQPIPDSQSFAVAAGMPIGGAGSPQSATGKLDIPATIQEEPQTLPQQPSPLGNTESNPRVTGRRGRRKGAVQQKQSSKASQEPEEADDPRPAPTRRGRPASRAAKTDKKDLPTGNEEPQAEPATTRRTSPRRAKTDGEEESEVPATIKRGRPRKSRQTAGKSSLPTQRGRPKTRDDEDVNKDEEEKSPASPRPTRRSSPRSTKTAKQDTVQEVQPAKRRRGRARSRAAEDNDDSAKNQEKASKDEQNNKSPDTANAVGDKASRAKSPPLRKSLSRSGKHAEQTKDADEGDGNDAKGKEPAPRRKSPPRAAKRQESKDETLTEGQKPAARKSLARAAGAGAKSDDVDDKDESNRSGKKSKPTARGRSGSRGAREMKQDNDDEPADLRRTRATRRSASPSTEETNPTDTNDKATTAKSMVPRRGRRRTEELPSDDDGMEGGEPEDDMAGTTQISQVAMATLPQEFTVGTIVDVQSRTWPGVNKLGGVARVTKVNPDGSYNVSYVLGGKESNLSPSFVSLADESGKRKRSEAELPRRLLKQLAAQGFDTTAAGVATPKFQIAVDNKGKTNTDETAPEGNKKAKANIFQDRTNRKRSRSGDGSKAAKKTKRTSARGSKKNSPKNSTRKSNEPDDSDLSVASGASGACEDTSSVSSRKRKSEGRLSGGKKVKIVAKADVPVLSDDEACKLADQMYENKFQEALKKKTIHVVASSLCDADMTALEDLRKKFKSRDVKIKIDKNIGKHTDICVTPSDPQSPKSGLATSSRTMKAMSAALSGVPIVSPDWVETCSSKNDILPPSPVMRTLPTKTKRIKQDGYHSFGVARLAANILNFGIGALPLVGYEIHLRGDFGSNRQEIESLIRSAGGSILPLADDVSDKLQAVVTSASESDAEKYPTVVLACQDKQSGALINAKLEREVKEALKHSPRSVLVVDRSWIFDSITCGRALPSDSFPLTNSKAKGLWELTKKN